MKKIAEGVTVDKAVRFGRPVLEGTRVPVDLVVGKLAGGMSVDEVAEEYELSHEAVRAALSYAAHSLAEEEVRVLA